MGYFFSKAKTDALEVCADAKRGIEHKVKMLDVEKRQGRLFEDGKKDALKEIEKKQIECNKDMQKIFLFETYIKAYGTKEQK